MLVKEQNVKDLKEKRKDRQRIFTNVFCFVSGLALFMLAQVAGLGLDLGVAFFVIGSGLLLYGTFDSLYFMMKNDSDFDKRNFAKNQKGLAWILGVAILSIIFMPFIYWILQGPYEALYTSIMGQYTFTGVTADVITLVNLLLSYLMGLCLASIAIWVLVNAKAESRY